MLFCDHDLLNGATGAVLRDDKGNFIAGGCWRIDWCADVLTAKALALKFGLSLAQWGGCNQLVINSDNLEVIETMNNGRRSAGVAAAIFYDCYYLGHVYFLLLVLNNVIGKQIRLLMNLLLNVHTTQLRKKS